MDDHSIEEIADIMSIYSYQIDAIKALLVEKNLISKDEINNKLIQVMDESKGDPATDEYVIEELKKKVLLK